MITHSYIGQTLIFIPHTINIVLRRINFHLAANSRH